MANELEWLSQWGHRKLRTFT